MSDSTRKQTTEEDRDRDGTRREILGRGGQETEMWAVSASAENWTIDQSRRPTDGRTDGRTQTRTPPTASVGREQKTSSPQLPSPASGAARTTFGFHIFTPNSVKRRSFLVVIEVFEFREAEEILRRLTTNHGVRSELKMDTASFPWGFQMRIPSKDQQIT